MPYYNKKIVKSGDIIEVYEYEKDQFRSSIKRENKVYNTKEPSERERTEEEILEDDRKNANKRMQNLRRLINANKDDLQKFFTLTFKENITDLSKAYDELKKFKMRLKYYLKQNYKGKELKYVVVVEFQKRGAVHFHMLCNLPYIDCSVLAKMWGNGFVRINKIETVDNVGSYVVKYMGKDFDDDRVFGRKRYNRSRNLKQPKEMITKKEVEEFAAQLPDSKKVYENTFENEYTGQIKYTQYNLVRD